MNLPIPNIFMHIYFYFHFHFFLCIFMYGPVKAWRTKFMDF